MLSRKKGYIRSINKWFRLDKFYASKVTKNYDLLLRLGRKKALELFHKASVNIPAYKDFLKRKKVNYKLVKTIEDYKGVPPTTKNNYIKKYPIEERCWGGDISRNFMISTSSGTTGKPNFWPRDLDSEIEGAMLHEYIFKEICGISKEKTLFINGFAMGNWIAGTFTLACAKLVAMKGYPLTIMTPGYSTESVIEILKQSIGKFEKFIITGHTPFLKELIEDSGKAGVKWNKIDACFLGTGQAVSEKWRRYIIDMIGKKDYYRTFINLYGSADAALMGFETPLTIYYRQVLSENLQLRQSLFNDKRVPSLCQYDPRLTFFEDINGEIHITKNSGCPLIKYNINDVGGVIGFPDMSGRFDSFKTAKHLQKPGARVSAFPFVYLFGREKFMIKIYGANIYAEHLQTALLHPYLREKLSGRFKLECLEDKNHNPKFVCNLELAKNYKTKKDEFKKRACDVLARELVKINSEYKFVLGRLGKKAMLKVKLFSYGESENFPTDRVVKTA